jgi:manganese efflux pump family protein
VVALLLVAVSAGLSNLAAALGIGMSGVTAATRLRVGLVFGACEAGMPLIGLLIGAGLAAGAGQWARWVGAATLIGLGAMAVLRPSREPAVPTAARLPRLILSGLALSLDNLAIGFALGTLHVPVVAAAVVIPAVSVAMSLAGLEIGGRLGAAAGRRGEQASGVILIGVGAAMAAGCCEAPPGGWLVARNSPVRKAGTMRVAVDPEQCEANGVCAGLVPGVFDLDDDDQLHVRVTEIPENLVGVVRQAVASCPKLALRLVE